MRPVRVEAPTGVLVSVAELKKQIRTDTDDEDDLVEAYRNAAIDYLDGYTGRLGRCILRQKWALPLIGGSNLVMLPFPDCRDFAIERLELDASWSVVDGIGIQGGYDCVRLTDTPDDWTNLHLTFWAGWETPADVPDNLKQALRMLVAHWFDNRSAASIDQSANPVPMGVEALIAPLVSVFV